MFESEFLTSDKISKETYKVLLAQMATLLCETFPGQPYAGESPTSLNRLIGEDFLPEQSSTPNQIARALQTVVANSVSISHPHTAAHLHCPPLLASLAAEVVISGLNQSMDSFDQAPIATVVEQKIVRWLCNEVGFPGPADGTFTTGGSQSNYMGLLLARDTFIQKEWGRSVQKEGLPAEARSLRILCSDVAHFTVERSASQLGLGTDSVVRVETDDRFRLKPSSLRDAINSLQRNGFLPMAIVATAGTTDFGSIDPLPEISSVACEANAWLHVDAAFGGALLFSPRHRKKLAGIELVDSLAIDFHKLFWQPIPCSSFLLRDAANLNCIKTHADYLNPEAHEEEGIPNLVTTSLLTSRRFDALKLWISLQSLGRDKLATMIDRTIALAAHTAAFIRGISHLKLLSEPQLTTVVFRYTPKLAVDSDALNIRIKQDLFHEGLAVIGNTRVRGRQCLKFTCMNPTTTESQMEKLVAMIVDRGKKLESAQ